MKYAVLLLLFFLSMNPLRAEEMTRKAALERIVKAEAAEADWFAPEFLQAIPIFQLNLVLAQVRAPLGKFEEVRPDGKNFLVAFEKGLVPTQITLTKEGKVIGLLFQPARARTKDLAEVAEKFKALPGKVSVLALENGQEKLALNGEQALAVGSALKLPVLLLLKQDTEAGKRRWEDVTNLREDWKSLPSGMIQDAPAGSPMTLHSLAMLMISISDNTATDHLIHLLGRERVEPLAPRNRPFITTREAFIIKGDPSLAKRFAPADEAGRRQILEEITKLPLPTESFHQPTALEAEWYFTPRELTDLMAQVRDLPLMAINPGFPPKTAWQRIAYKGGSEPGVLCHVIGAKAKDGREILVAAIWNNPEAPVDQALFDPLISDLLDKLK
jgi:beta-lactamase class A